MNEYDGAEKLSESSVEFFDRMKWMTSQEAADYLRVSAGQVRNLVSRGDLKCYRFRCRLRFLREDLDRLMKPCF